MIIQFEFIITEYLIIDTGISVVGIVSLEPPTLFGAWMNNNTLLGGRPHGNSSSLSHIVAYKVGL